MLLWIWFGFLLGALALALVVFPHWREALLVRVQRSGQRVESTSQQWAKAVHQSGRTVALQSVAVADGWQQRVRQQWPWIALTLALLFLPAGGAWWWAATQGHDLEAFEDVIEPGNHQVAQLLQGEHLVPPPPLPPDVFLTEEIQKIMPQLSTADRRWDQMDEAFVQRLLLVFKIMREEHGYDMALLEGYRSPERQDMLAAKGMHVTQARGGQSYHQHGLAADCAFLRGGKLVISEKDPWAMRGYELYGQVAEQVGLTWGGRWQMMDFGHVEWRKPGVKLARKS